MKKINITRQFQKEIPRICLHMAGVRTFVSSLYGPPSIISSGGGSVPRAIAAKVSMMRLIHKSCTADSGDSA